MVTFKYKGYHLSTPESFRDATPEERYLVCNGMGPKGRGFLVPDTMYLLDLGPAGDIHDWMYAFHEGHSRELCDQTFLNNMYAVIDQNDSWGWLKWLRKRRALKYYWAVREWGKAHYKGPVIHDSRF